MSSVLPLRLSLFAGVCLAGFAMIGGGDPAFAAGSDAQSSSPQAEPQQDGAQEPSEANPQDQIIVQGRRLKGQLDVEQAPLLELDEEDIAAEGVASIADLIQQVQNRTGSARGRGGGGFGVLLINGIRPGSFREIFSYPPEALAKVEVFPEEVAQRFGFPPDQRVINLILKDNYGSREVELEFEGPSRGGRFVNEQELGYLKIANGGRFNFNFTAQDASLLSEAERDIIQTQGSVSELESDPNQAEFRTLQPDRRGLEASLSWARAYPSSGISVSSNVEYSREDTSILDGLNLVTLIDANGNSLLRSFGEDNPLERRTARDRGSVSASLSAPVNAFRLTTTFDASLTESTTQIDNRFDTSALEQAALDGILALNGELPSTLQVDFETAFSRNWQASSLTTLRGPLVDLPGGELLTTFDLGYSWNRLESADSRNNQDVQLTRGNLQSGANFVIPITSRRNGFADALGSFTLNAQVGVEELSDFGTLGDYNLSLNWSPVDGLNLSSTYIYREVAPALASLGNPQITNFNVPVFDFVNNEAVLAQITSGGNPDLPAETQRDWKFAVNFELPFIDGTRFTAEYIRNRSDDVTRAFPLVTSEIEAAFPDRITRDALGALIAVDRRPISFAETRSDRLQFRLSTRGGFGGNARGGPPGGRRGAGGGAPPAAANAASGVQARGGQARGGRGAGFMAFREKLCAEGGLDLLKQVVETVKNGGDISALAPGLPPQMVERIVARLNAQDGEISEERLIQARDRICASGNGNANRSGNVAGNSGGNSGSSPQNAGGTPPPAFNPLARGARSGWRYFANLTHTIELQSEILIAPGVGVLDQLDGDATDPFGFPRHSTRLEAGMFGNGMGFRLSGRYTGETRLNGSGGPGSSDLFFADLATFNLRFFGNVDQITGSKSPTLKNLRVSLRMDNIFDGQRAVRDENGQTPVTYQPFFIDPVGRFVGIDIRKLF